LKSLNKIEVKCSEQGKYARTYVYQHFFTHGL